MATKATGRTKVTGKGVTAKPAARNTARPATKSAGKATKPAAKAAVKPPVKSAPKPAAKPAAKAAVKAAPKPAPKKVPSPKPTAKATKPAPAAKTAPPKQTPAPSARPPAKPTVAAKPAPTAAPAAPPAATPEAAPAPAVAAAPSAPPPAAKAQPPKKPLPAKPPVAANANAAPANDPPAAPPPPEFAVGDHVVYPTHGVGRVTGIVNEEIAGHRLTLIVVEFEENRMVLRVPVAKAKSAGLRKLSSRKAIDLALSTLKGRARVKRTMWSRRAQEYEAKINSGDPIAIAEVVRDLHRNAGQPDQSFSERQIYEQAMDRLAAELAAIEQVDKPTAAAKLATVLKAA
jgi:CarD family transcriptional regulator